MSDLRKVGEVYKDELNRDIYVVMQEEGDIYFFSPGSFYQGLTRFAEKGCKMKDVFQKMEQIEQRENDEKELGFV